MISKPLSSFLLVVVLCCLDIGTVRAGEFETHYRRGMELYEAKNYDEAAGELLKAYELRQLPRVLLNLGTIYRKSGKAIEAQAFYERYLKAEPNPPPKIKKDLDQFMAQTKALVETPEVQSEIERRKQEGTLPGSTPVAAQPKAEEPKPPIFKRPWFWGVIGGVVVAGIITGVTVGVIAHQRQIPTDIDIIKLQLSF